MATRPSRFNRPRAGDRALRAIGVPDMLVWSMLSEHVEDGVD
jgi:hypothetical protein